MEIFTRGVEEVIVREHLGQAMRSGRKLRVKFGIDPTAPDLHLGHTVPLRKLRGFQDLGHKAVLIIGDFTAMVGDPSGRNEARKPLSEKEIRANLKRYLSQAGKILDIKKAEVRYNSEWHKKGGVASLCGLMSKVSVQRALERDDFQNRMGRGEEVSMLEAVYPLLQGYDSVAVRSDVEIGGADQKFNLLMGRRIQRRCNQKEQDILTTWLIEGTDGGRKMSKSAGNYIGLRESPENMFGKIMSVPDHLIVKYFITLTSVPAAEVEVMRRETDAGNTNPRDLKLRLGGEIVSMYHSARAARKAREGFIRTFSKHELPEEIPAVKLGHGGAWDPAALLTAAGLAPSKSEARRLVAQGAVEIDGQVLALRVKTVTVERGMVIRVGKRRFVKLMPE
jgi:tyrosyl-tRNA synthetase